MAEETFELYALTSKLTLDTSQFDRAYDASRGKMRSLAGDVKGLETATRSGKGGVDSFGGALNGLTSKLNALGGPSGAIGIVTVGIGLYATAITVTAKGVWDLTSRFSDLGSELKDMSDQVNISTQTLATFQGIGHTMGIEVDAISTGLVTFQKNLAGGNDALKALNVTSKDNETALRQTFKALSDVQDKTLQTALAQEIFGKSGKIMLAFIKETGGDLDAATEKLRGWNVLMSDDAIYIADQFGEKLDVLSLRFQGIGNTIATETAPAFIAAFDQIGAALDANAVDWRWWGEQIGNIVVSSTAIISGFIQAVEGMSIVAGPGAFIMAWKEGMDQAIAEMNARRGEFLRGAPEGSGGGRIPGPAINWKPGGGGKGKKGKTDAEREAEKLQREAERREEMRTDTVQRLTSEIKKYEDQLKGVDVTTRAYALAEERLIGIWQEATPAVYEQAQAIAKAADNKGKQLSLQTELAAFMKQQDAAVKLAIEGEKSHTQATEDFITSLERQGAVLQDTTKAWLRFAAAMRDSFALIESAPERIDKVTQAFPLPTIIFPTQTEDQIATGAGEAANREAGLPPPELVLDPMVKWREALEDFSHDITFTISDSIEEGFRDGVDAGILEFVRGVLAMAKHEALSALQRAIFNAMNPKSAGSGEEGGGGSGFFKTAIKFGLSALGALFGGGASAGGLGSAAAGAIGGAADGGYQPAGKWYWRGEEGPELVRAGPGGDTVMSNPDSLAFAGMMAGGGTINIYAQDVRQAFSRETLTQAKRKFQKLQRGR